MRIGVVGGGQLGRMVGLAGVPLGCSFTFLDPSEAAGARAVGELIVGDYDDEDRLHELAARSDVVTYEFENVPAGAARRVADEVPVFPPPRSLELTQDRASEKQLFERCGIEVSPYALADGPGGVSTAVKELGLPLVVKTRREGYDGKGQFVARSESDVDAHAESVQGIPLLAELLVDFSRELSIVAVRGRDGDVVTYPLVENLHYEGILRLTRAPALGVERVREEADRAVRALLEELDHVGALTVELFETSDGRLLGNEMAPRVHNSGHWTIEGAETSQFENHVRAVAGLPLGSSAPRGHSAMVNLIGAIPDASDVLKVDGAHLHLYDKQPRPGRKVGHITVRRDRREDVDSAIEALESLPGTYLGAPDRSLPRA
ncbi:MAG TPA: 5-(carboxyamino)imidazole ribonucleotide synthase [Actinomycetota bacterium]|nr:5-(carboxyamino)imidazole ribonucleotide synthase [Actinomycetota bacterium]